jgi:hypothetical protein
MGRSGLALLFQAPFLATDATSLISSETVISGCVSSHSVRAVSVGLLPPVPFEDHRPLLIDLDAANLRMPHPCGCPPSAFVVKKHARLRL